MTTEPVGFALFDSQADEAFATRMTTVRRGNGLADAMYVVAEVVAGRTLYDFWGDTGSQSKDGQGLWKWFRKDGRARPFVRPERGSRRRTSMTASTGTIPARCTDRGEACLAAYWKW